MRINSISISDTFGTKIANFEVGTVTRIRGYNGSGKSSILKALSFVFAGGSDPSVIRQGAEQSKIVIRLDDGTSITKVTRPKRARKGGEITGYATDLEVTQPDGTPRNAPQSYINDLAQSMACDPTILLRMDSSTVPGRKALAAELMKLVPIRFQPEEITACGVENGAMPIGRDALDLDGLKKVHATVTEERRRFGQTRDEAEGACTRLRSSLPEDDGVDYSAKLAELDERRLEVERAIGDRRVEIEATRGANITDATKDHREAVATADAAYAEAVRLAEAVRTAAREKATAALNAAKQQASEKAEFQLAELEAESRPEAERVVREIATVKERLAATQRVVVIRKEIGIHEVAHKGAIRKYDHCSEVLQRLDKLRLAKLNDLPVPGLVVEDGNVYLDGIPWHNVNLARRVEACLQICTQQGGKLPFLILDDSEHLDSETRAAIEEGLAAAGYQIIEAVVSDGPLTIETAEPIAA
jgi:energy-coupling factor transporter ATP-binding protein EcfA2